VVNTLIDGRDLDRPATLVWDNRFDCQVAPASWPSPLGGRVFAALDLEGRIVRAYLDYESGSDELGDAWIAGVGRIG
jgi:hypothetical protein